jgi:hypothetical protein
MAPKTVFTAKIKPALLPKNCTESLGELIAKIQGASHEECGGGPLKLDLQLRDDVLSLTCNRCDTSRSIKTTEENRIKLVRFLLENNIPTTGFLLDKPDNPEGKPEQVVLKKDG